MELPEQVVVEVGRSVRVFSMGGSSGISELRVRRWSRVVEVVLEELLDVDLLQGVAALASVLGLLLRRSRSAAIGLLDRHLLQQRVLHDLLLEHLGQLQGGEGQELDGLLERRGEDEPLGEAGVRPSFCWMATSAQASQDALSGLPVHARSSSRKASPR